MRRFTLAVALGVLGAGALSGCFGSQEVVSVNGGPDEGVPDVASGDDSPAEAASPPIEAGPDTTVAQEASLPPPEAGPDEGVQEAGEDVVEASPEAEAEATAEAAAPEAGLDATIDVSDASDASSFCVAQIFGDHYVRPDGELIYAPGGTHTVITNAATSTPLLGISEIVQQYGNHACGLRASDGTVWCWALGTSGGNTNGDLGNGSFGGPNLGVGVATQVVTNAADAGAPTYLTGVVHLSTASTTFYTFPTCAIRSDKTVWCWGDASSEGGYIFQGTTGSNASVPYAIAISAAAGDGGPPPPLKADQVSVGMRHACVLLGGIVSCWGQNIAGNLANGDVSLAFKPYPIPVITGDGLPATVDAIGSGYDFSCALAGGSVWCWGTNGANQIGNPSVPQAICNLNYCEPQPTPVQASAPDGGSTQVVDAGVDQNPLTNIVSLVVGYQYACGLDVSGSIWCWGSYVAGSTKVSMAVPYTSATVPYTNVTRISGSGEGIGDGLRYTTASGVYVSAGQAYAPYCQ